MGQEHLAAISTGDGAGSVVSTKSTALAITSPGSFPRNIQTKGLAGELLNEGSLAGDVLVAEREGGEEEDYGVGI